MKKIITFLMCAGILAMLLSSCNRKIYNGGARDFDTVNIGTTANDGTGDPIRTGFRKLNIFINHANTIGWDNLTAQDILNLRHAANIDLDSIKVSGIYSYLFDGADTSTAYVPLDMRDDAATLFTQPISFAGDTSLYPVPDKVGDLYINSVTGIAYLSVYAVRGGWRRITNLMLPVLFVIGFRRRRRK